MVLDLFKKAHISGFYIWVTEYSELKTAIKKIKYKI